MSEDAERRSVGRLQGALSKIFTKSATLLEARSVAEGFRWLKLGGDALRNVAWTPGQKVQLMLGGWVQRTYTPLSWDGENGVIELLAYMHGAYPGSEWARSLQVGEPCAVFGPRGSIDLSTLERPGVLFGDETSFGLAHALRHTPGGQLGVHLLFEVTAEAAAREALAAVGVREARLVGRKPADAHHDELELAAADLFQTERARGWVLSGKAPSIARLRKRLGQLDVPRRQIQTKAYWAPGKVGLD